jgi:ComF family protein
MIKKFIHIFWNFLFPQKCLGCGEENSALCRECLAKIGMPTAPKEDNIFSASDYGDEVVKKAIWMLKYRGAKNLAEPLAELIFQRTLFPKNGLGLVVPIPLSKKRKRERGYNQAELLAIQLAEKIKIPVCADALVKIKDTPAQVSVKNRSERLKNLDGAFAVKNAEKISGRNVILIDDVSTTGATLKEAKKVLRNAGAKKIISAVVARG